MVELEEFLTGAMAFVFRIGWIIGALCIAVGLIMYLSGWNEYQGNRLLFGGFFLFFVFLYLHLGYVVQLFGPGPENQTQTEIPPTPTP